MQGGLQRGGVELLAQIAGGAMSVHQSHAISEDRARHVPDQVGVDVLAPEGYAGISGGGEREPSLETLESRISAHELPHEAFQWYLDLRRFGTVPHGGFGLGLERTVCWLAGIDHVRECIPFPRMLYRIYP